MTKKKQETIKATNDWIKKIKATGQYKNVEDSDFVNASTLRVSAFNFNDLVGDVVIIKSRTHQYYIKIHNKHFINWFDSPSAPQVKRCYIKNGKIYKNGVES